MKICKRITAMVLVLALLVGFAAIAPEVFVPSATAAAVIQAGNGAQLIDTNTQWRYLDNGTDPAAANDRTGWTAVDFDDSSWKTNGSTAARFGSKRGQIADLGNGITPAVLLNHYLSDDTTGVPTYFFRTSFELSGATSGLLLTGTVLYDDAVIIYINGQKVISYHEPEGGFASNLSYGGSNATAPIEEKFTLDASCLQEGVNTIAVEVHNGKASSSDVYFELTSLSLSQPAMLDITQTWKYLDDGTDPAGTSDRTSWTEADFDDSEWKTSEGHNARFGALTNKLDDLGNGAVPEVKLNQYLDGTTVNTPAFFFRTTFQVEEVPQGGYMLSGEVKFDDAIIIYINGQKVASLGEPEGGFETNLSYGGTNGIAPSDAVFRVDTACLHQGTNVLAVELHQGRASSPDIYFEMSSLNFTVTQQKNFALTVGADETQRNVTWYVNSDIPGLVQYAPKTGEDFPATYDEVQATSTEASNYVGFYSNKATMSQLLPNTTYVYRLVNGSTVSDIRSFTTGGSEDFSFLFMGDPQIGTSSIASDAAAWEDTLEAAMTMFPDTDFMISAGDQVNSPENESEYTAYLSAESLQSLTSATTIGNHDNGSIAYTEHFNNPNTVSSDGSTYGNTTAGCNYWYTYNNVLFLHINSGNQSTAEHKIFMQNAIAQNQDVDWKIVVFHHSIFSAAGHALNEDILNRRANLAPLFKELDIDVVLMGHDHVYVRTYMMDGLTPDKSAGVQSSVTNPEGILYITANSASGSKYYDVLPNTTFDYAAVIDQDYGTSFSNVEVTEDSFTITTYRTSDGSIIDSFEILKSEVAPAAAMMSLTRTAAATTAATASQLRADRTDGAVTLDGNLSEFASASSLAVGNATVKALWDNTYLYLAVAHGGVASGIDLSINGSAVTAHWSGNTVTGSTGVTGYATATTAELRIYAPAAGVVLEDFGESFAVTGSLGTETIDTQIIFATGDNRSTIDFAASTQDKYIVGFTRSGTTYALNSTSFSGEAYLRTGWHTTYYNVLGTNANYRSQALAFNHTFLISKLPAVSFKDAANKVLGDEQGVVLYLHDMRAADSAAGVARDEDCILASIYREDDESGNQNLYLYVHSDVNGGKRNIISLGKTVGQQFDLSLLWSLDNQIEVYVDGALVGTAAGIDSGYVGFGSTDIGGCWVKNVTGQVDVTVTNPQLQTVSAASLASEIQSMKDAGTLTTASLIGTTTVSGNLPATYYGVHIPITWSVVDGIVSASGLVSQPATDTTVTLTATIGGVALTPATVTVTAANNGNKANPGDWLEMARFNSGTFNKGASGNFVCEGNIFRFDNETVIDSDITVTNGDLLSAAASSGGINTALDHGYYDICLEQTLRIDALPVKSVGDHGVFYGKEIYARGYTFHMSDRVSGSTNGQDNVMICTIQNIGSGKLALFIANDQHFSAYGSTAIDLGRTLGQEFKLSTVWNTDGSVDVYVDGRYVSSVAKGTRALYYKGNDSVGFAFRNLDGYAKITVSDVKLSADDLGAKMGSKWYRTVHDALSVAPAGETVTLRKDVYADVVMIPADVTLDIKGNDLYAVSGVVAYGQVIDTVGTSVLRSSEDALMLVTNAQSEYLPLYDSDCGGWRLFTYELQSLGAAKQGDNARFGFALRFADQQVYSMLMDEENAGLDFALNLAWTGNEEGVCYTFAPQLLAKYGQLTQSFSGTNLQPALILNVTGLDALAPGSELWVTPTVTTSAGAESIGNSIDITV